MARGMGECPRRVGWVSQGGGVGAPPAPRATDTTKTCTAGNRAVRILLECILVICVFTYVNDQVLFLQTMQGTTRHYTGSDMESETYLRLSLSSGHRREDVHTGTYVGSSSHEHDYYWVHDDVL